MAVPAVLTTRWSVLMALPPGVVTRPCACGGYLTAHPGHSFHAVERHNGTIEHRSWWSRVRIAWQGEDS